MDLFYILYEKQAEKVKAGEEKCWQKKKLIEYKERVFKNLWILWEIHIKIKSNRKGDAEMIYLDNAATTMRKPPQVVQAVVKALESICLEMQEEGHIMRLWMHPGSSMIQE